MLHFETGLASSAVLQPRPEHVRTQALHSLGYLNLEPCRPKGRPGQGILLLLKMPLAICMLFLARISYGPGSAWFRRSAYFLRYPSGSWRCRHLSLPRDLRFETDNTTIVGSSSQSNKGVEYTTLYGSNRDAWLEVAELTYPYLLPVLQKPGNHPSI